MPTYKYEKLYWSFLHSCVGVNTCYTSDFQSFGLHRNFCMHVKLILHLRMSVSTVSVRNYVFIQC